MLNCCLPRPCDCDEYCPCCGRRKHHTYPWRSSPWYIEPQRPIYIEPRVYPQVGRPYNPGNPNWKVASVNMI